MTSRSFSIGTMTLSRGERKLLMRGAVCLRKQHMHVVAMEVVREEVAAWWWGVEEIRRGVLT